MTHTENLTRYIAQFVEQLAQNGVRDVVMSPGSRSTPLAMTFTAHETIKSWVNMDERSAGFFALGIAKQTNRPVALVCTSGTAAANYYPAIIEAYYSRVPLLVLTADRPHELRDVGAPQAINQLRLYGEYTKWFQELALPEGSKEALAYIRSIAARAVHVANSPNKGIVHLNFPLREPLVPDFSLPHLWEEQITSSYLRMEQGSKRLSQDQLYQLHEQFSHFKQGIIVCGPMETQSAQAEIIALAEAWQIPVFADPLSQLRQGNRDHSCIIDSYDAILKEATIRYTICPEFVIRFGAMPVSKPYTLWLREHPEIAHYIVEESEGFRSPVGERTTFLYTDPANFCSSLMALSVPSFERKWLLKWQQFQKYASDVLRERDTTTITEGHAVVDLVDQIPDHSTLFIGNSMAIRDVDTFWFSTEKTIRMLANRGANGIDGVTSSALGAATASKRVTLLIGDLSFFHDQNGLLMAKQYGLNITIILVNNNGGGIFSFLPQAKEQVPYFEALFGTPLNLELFHVVQLYQGYYTNPKNWEDYRQELKQSYQRPGLTVIELQTSREQNASWHEQKWNKISDYIKDEMNVHDD